MSGLMEKVEKLKSLSVSQLEEIGVDNIDMGTIDDIANRMKILIDNSQDDLKIHDGLLVATSDETELETVRRNFVEKKLGIEDNDEAMKIINEVAEQMSPIRMKQRVAFYYLLTKKVS